MKKRLFLILLTCLGSLALIALSYGKEHIANSNFSTNNPVRATKFNRENNQTDQLTNNISQEEKLDSEISHLVKKALALGYYNYARQQIDLIEDLPLKIELLRELTHAYLAVGENQKAFSTVNQAVALDKQTGSFDSITWATDWLLTGQEQKVKNIIANLDETGEQQAQIRLALAQSYLKVGQIVPAFELAKLIPADIIFVPDDYPDPRDELLQGIVEQALQQNNFDLASEVALSFPRKIEQVTALIKIARQYFQQGKYEQGKLQLDQALKITKLIDVVPVIVDRHTFWSEPNANLLLDLAQDYEEIGQRQQAIELLGLATESIKNFKTQFTFDVVVWNRSQALRKIASRYLDFGEKEKARAILDLATQEANKFRRKREVLIKELLAIAAIYLKIGQRQQAAYLWEEAFYKLQIIEPKSAELVLETAKLSILVGHKEEGIKLIETTQSFLMQLEIAALAGDKQLTEKLAEKELQKINQLPFSNDKLILLEQIAASLAENQEIAFNFLEKIKNPWQKAKILVAISQKYSQKDNWNVANNILNKAIATAETIPEQKQREQWYTETTNRLININEVDANLLQEKPPTIPLWQLQLAEKITQKSNSSKLMAEVLFKITQSQLIETNEQTALKSLKKIIKILNSPALKKEFMAEFLELFQLSLKSNKNDLALAIAQNLEHTDYKIVSLRQVAQKYILNRNKEKAQIILSQVIKIVQTIEDSSRKQELIEGITEQKNKITDS